jgi:Zn-dependent peptidase ImmA (M78 family)/transcriptional regulator with XRE-family HTH domain
LTQGSFDPVRLVLARQAAGLKKKELAERVGISPASVTQYEAGNTLPRPAMLATLALACGFPAEFLAYDGQTSRPAQAALPYFRSLRSTRTSDREEAEARAVLVWLVVRTLERHVDLPSLKLPSFPVGDHEELKVIDRYASEVRNAWSMPNGPVASVVNLMENNGAVCARLGTQHDRIDAFSQWMDGRPYVLLWRNKNDAARSRFDAAHELGHLVMHPDPDPGNKIMERQAHAFAAAFLMPENDIIDVLPRMAPKRKDIAGLVDLRMEWGTSISAIYFRSRELGLISSDTHRRAMIRLSEFGFRKEEPGEVEIESPMVLSTAIGILEEALGYGVPDLAREARLSEQQVIDICELWDKPSLEMATVTNISGSVPQRKIG